MNKTFDFDIKSLDTTKTGAFTGYASVFGVVDAGNEIVVKGAFSESLSKREAMGRKLPILWNHKHSEPIGVYDSVKEDDRGLLVDGRLLVDDVQRAKETHALMKAGAVSGLSIGYGIVEDGRDTGPTRARLLKRLRLEEASLVTFPMLDSARVHGVKAIEEAIKAGGLPSLSEFEDFLREAGFSKSQATVIAGRGLKDLLSRSESGGTTSDVPAWLRTYKVHQLTP